MATATFLAVLALGFYVQVCLSGTITLGGSNESLNNLCKSSNESHLVSTPVEDCTPNWYIMCEKGKADTKAECPSKEIFNPVGQWCEPENDTPLPPGCSEKKKIVISCATEPQKFPVNTTCKFYKYCGPFGEHMMPCPKYSYYIAEMRQCMSITEPYGNMIPREAMADCDRKDPIRLTIPATATRSP